MEIWDFAAHDVHPLVDRYITQETLGKTTFDGRSVIKQLCYNIIAIES